jgi:two-component system nitrate/nitrite response regulator NarL
MERCSLRCALPDRPGLRIAVIDDHELVREGLVSLLSSQPSIVDEVVYSGFDVDAAAETRPDVALLDVDLGLTGGQVGDAVLALRGVGAQVLLISAFEDPGSVRAALEVGALGFVPKRVSFETLLEAIDTVSRGELFLSVDLASILAAARDTPNLSPRELDALRLYASGLKLSAVAHRMEISPHTAKEYLDRVRTKYANMGRQARTRTELYVAANRDGLLGPAAPGADAPGSTR